MTEPAQYTDTVAYLRKQLAHTQDALAVWVGRAMVSNAAKAEMKEELASWRMAAQEAEKEVAALRKQRDEAHRQGYDMAREQARELGAHIVAYEVAMGLQAPRKRSSPR